MRRSDDEPKRDLALCLGDEHGKAVFGSASRYGSARHERSDRRVVTQVVNRLRASGENDKYPVRARRKLGS